MAGGDVTRVVKALIAAHSANIDLSVAQAKAIDLAGRDVYQAVRTSVVPQIIETPMVSAVAKDGIELKAIKLARAAIINDFFLMCLLLIKKSVYIILSIFWAIRKSKFIFS